MKILREPIKEKWYTFIRFYCKEGWIDKVTMDSANDPEKDTKSSINLNSFSTYYRLNSNKWVHGLDLKKSIMDDILDYQEVLSSYEIFNSNLN